jgi:hypothetical protein
VRDEAPLISDKEELPSRQYEVWADLYSVVRFGSQTAPARVKMKIRCQSPSADPVLWAPLFTATLRHLTGC